MPDVMGESKSAAVSRGISQQMICGDWVARMDEDTFPEMGSASYLLAMSVVPTL